MHGWHGCLWENGRVIHHFLIEFPDTDFYHFLLFAKVLRVNAAEKEEVFQIAQVFNVQVVDIGNDSVLLECKLTARRNNELIALLKSKFKTIEVVRGGAVAIESISTSCR